MITILHGDNIVASRAALSSELERISSQGFALRRLETKQLTVPSLEGALGTQELFTPKVIVVIEELFSLPKSKKKDELIALLSQAAVDVLLWEKKALTVTQLRGFPQAKVQAFKTSSAVFAWLDVLRPGNTQQNLSFFERAEQHDGAEMCFAMLSRQVRLLLQIKDGAAMKLAPFAIAKLQKQAKMFTADQLLSIHKKLVEIDWAMKTSTSSLDLRQQLTQLLVGW